MTELTGRPYDELDEYEQELLNDILDSWLEGNKLALTETTKDRSIESAQELVDVAGGYNDQAMLIASIKDKLGLGVKTGAPGA